MEELYCQSCGMPLKEKEDFGTNADLSQNREYCSYCYQKGEFQQPDITMEEMINLSVEGMAEAIPDMTAEKAREILKEMY